ncbi:MAG: tetratricopeptide repeat protein [Candidatus Cryptobacteroides sp.]
MKKIVLLAAALFLSAAVMSAQDMAQATETYNNGAMALQMGDNNGALDAFRQALEMGSQCGEEGAELVANCKEIIPKIVLSIGKDYVKAENFDAAVEQFGKAAEIATEYGNDDVASEAKSLIPQVLMQSAGKFLNAKDYANAAVAYAKVVEIEPANGMAHLRLGMSYGALGKTEEAIAAYNAAIENGQENAAKKQLSNMFVKKAAADLKAKKYDDAIKAALTSNDYLENATAMKVAGTAASQLQKNEDAIKYLEKYLELSPNAKDANQMCYTIAALAQTLGNKEKAKTYYQKIVADPKFGETAKQQLQAL